MRNAFACTSFLFFFVACDAEDPTDSGDSAGPDAGRAASAWDEVEEIHLYSPLGAIGEQTEPREHNPLCDQVTPQNFQDNWEDLDGFLEECRDPDFWIVNGISNLAVNTLTVRAFTRGRGREIDISSAEASRDLDIKLFHFYTGEDIDCDMCDAYWEFLDFRQTEVDGRRGITLVPETDRFALPAGSMRWDPTAQLMVGNRAANTYSNILVVGVNPSLEGSWTVVAEGPTELAAHQVIQIGERITWKFFERGAGKGTFTFGELKVEFALGEGPPGIEGSGSFRAAQVTDPCELVAFFQYSNPGQGQTTGDVTFRRVDCTP